LERRRRGGRRRNTPMFLPRSVDQCCTDCERSEKKKERVGQIEEA